MPVKLSNKTPTPITTGNMKSGDIAIILDGPLKETIIQCVHDGALQELGAARWWADYRTITDPICILLPGTTLIIV